MLAMQAHITYTKGTIGTVKGAAKRKLPKLVKAALFDAVRRWHSGESFAPGYGKGKAVARQGFLKVHFTPNAFSRYPDVYRKRSRKYNERKMKAFGHASPLRWTGNTMREIMLGVRVSGTSKKARGRMSGANRALNFKPGGHDLGAELRTVNAHEAEQLAIYVGEHIADGIAKDTEQARS